MLLREMMRAKIHGITVTAKNLHYTGSLGIDARLLEAVGILPNEKIQVVNLANGERMETYAIRSPEGSGGCVLNGGMAHKGKEGDRLLVIAYAFCDEATALTLESRVAVVHPESNLQFDLVS